MPMHEAPYIMFLQKIFQVREFQLHVSIHVKLKNVIETANWKRVHMKGYLTVPYDYNVDMMNIQTLLMLFCHSPNKVLNGWCYKILEQGVVD